MAIFMYLWLSMSQDVMQQTLVTASGMEEKAKPTSLLTTRPAVRRVPRFQRSVALFANAQTSRCTNVLSSHGALRFLSHLSGRLHVSLYESASRHLILEEGSSTSGIISATSFERPMVSVLREKVKASLSNTI